MKLENPTEYFGALEYLERLNRALDLGRSYMTGDDWELFSQGMDRRIRELTDAIQEYKVKVDLLQLSQCSWQVQLIVEGTLPTVGGTISALQGFCLVPFEASVTWGSPAPNAGPALGIGLGRTVTLPSSVALPA